MSWQNNYVTEQDGNETIIYDEEGHEHFRFYGDQLEACQIRLVLRLMEESYTKGLAVGKDMKAGEIRRALGCGAHQ